MSLTPALLISSRSACEKPPPPQELLRTRTLTPACFARTAQSMAETAPLVEPEPLALRNLSAISRVVGLTPITPRPLFPTAPIVPETCVPWRLSSIGSHVAVMTLYPCVPPGQPLSCVALDQMLAARSGCV